MVWRLIDVSLHRVQGIFPFSMRPVILFDHGLFFFVHSSFPTKRYKTLDSSLTPVPELHPNSNPHDCFYSEIVLDRRHDKGSAADYECGHACSQTRTQQDAMSNDRNGKF